MARMQIALKGGAVIEADVIEVETARSRVTGELTRIRWEHTPNARRRLHTVEVFEIAAVVLVDDEDDADGAGVQAQMTETETP